MLAFTKCLSFFFSYFFSPPSSSSSSFSSFKSSSGNDVLEKTRWNFFSHRLLYPSKILPLYDHRAIFDSAKLVLLIVRKKKRKKRRKKKERRGKNKILPKRKREEEEKKSEKSQRNTKFPSSLTKEASSNESILLVQFRESEGPFSLSLSPSLSLPPVTKRNQLSRWAVFNRHSAWFELNFLLDSLILSINRWAGNPVERERPETTIYIYTHTHTHAHIYIYTGRGNV